MSDQSRGNSVADYARRLAGGLGVRDFVYEPVLVQRGGGSREISDGLLVAGTDGLILQVKSRERPVGEADSDDRAKAWCLKQGAAAQRQGTGTRRSLLRSPVRLRSLRGFERELPGGADWPIVVILDHPGRPLVSFASSPDTLYISLSDWLNLHRLVRSTAGVIEYVRRALSSGVEVALGQEEQRYQALAAAELQACDTLTSFPVLPTLRLSSQEGADAALFDDLVERVADPDGATGWDPEEYLKIVEILDRTPLIARTRIGAKMRLTFQDMVRSRARRSFLVAAADGPRLALVYEFDDGSQVASELGFQAQVGSYAVLRQHHALESGAAADSATLAIGVLHHPDRGRRYVFALVERTPPELPDELRADLEATYGVFDGRRVNTVN